MPVREGSSVTAARSPASSTSTSCTPGRSARALRTFFTQPPQSMPSTDTSIVSNFGVRLALAMSVPFLRVARASFDALRDVCKELFSKAEQFAHAGIASAVVDVASLARALDEAALLEARQVVRDVRLTQTRRFDDVTNAESARVERLQDGEAAWISQPAEELGRKLGGGHPCHWHAPTIHHRLMI